MYLEARRRRHRTNWQEQFSLAYVRAIAATAGVTCQIIQEDIDGIDVLLGADGSGGAIRFPKLEAQLKSWTAPVEREGRFRYPLKARNYEHLRLPSADLGLPRILVLVIMPRSPADWFGMTHETGPCGTVPTGCRWPGCRPGRTRPSSPWTSRRATSSR